MMGLTTKIFLLNVFLGSDISSMEKSKYGKHKHKHAHTRPILGTRLLVVRVRRDDRRTVFVDEEVRIQGGEEKRKLENNQRAGPDDCPDEGWSEEGSASGVVDVVSDDRAAGDRERQRRE